MAEKTPKKSTAPLFLVDDITNADSDKTFVVPAGDRWRIRSVNVNYASTATAGNRRLRIDFTTADDLLIASILAGFTQAASLTYNYTAAPYLPKDAAVTDLTGLLPLPDVTLRSGQKVRVRDNAAVAIAADNMHVRMTVERP